MLEKYYHQLFGIENNLLCKVLIADWIFILYFYSISNHNNNIRNTLKTKTLNLTYAGKLLLFKILNMLSNYKLFSNIKSLTIVFIISIVFKNNNNFEFWLVLYNTLFINISEWIC